MQNIRPTVPRTRRIPGPGGVYCLLLLYVVTATPLAPVAVALLAEMDRSHEVTIQSTAQGLQVVLRHDRPGSPAHRHGMVAQALTFFAQRPSARQSDHVIQFYFTDAGQRTLALTTESTCAPPVLNEGGAADFLFHPTDATFGGAAFFSRPPPAASELLLNIRSTVLLI